MAGGEARAVWQRTVNRCFVQEDAKRAPRLTCCQSSSTTSTNQVENSNLSRVSVDPLNQSSCGVTAGPMHLHQNPNLRESLPHDTRLWSHPHHIQVKKPVEAEVNNHSINQKNPESGVGEKQGKSLNSESFQEFIELMETRESYGSIGCDESYEKKLSEFPFDLSSPWNPRSSEKAGPWWRTTDKDELASLVAQRSLDHVENCDLPTPQKMKRSYCSSPRCFGSDGFRDYSVSSQTIHEYGTSGGGSCKNRTEALSESGLCKSELVEALRHSQKRAREAEKMAKEAYADKEHLVKLLLKQASELFGYKQWFQLLQLEVLYFQIKSKKIENNKKKNSNEAPDYVPWSYYKAGRNKRSKRATKPKSAKYSVGLALGMSLVGAGLLLGWTVGWMQILSF